MAEAIEVVVEQPANGASTAHSEIYTSDEKIILDKTKLIRIQMVDAMVAGGVPTKSGDVRVLNEVLTGLDKSVNDTATNRLKYQENNNQEDIANNVAALLIQMSKDKIDTKHIGVKGTSVSDDYIPDDIVDGELETGPTHFDEKDFIRNGL